MAEIRGEPSQDIALAGRRFRQKVAVALLLCAIVPGLLLVYVAARALGPSAGVAGTPAWLAILAVAGVLGVGAGAYVVWDLARSASRMADLLAKARALEGPDRQRDDIGAVMQSFDRMLGTIEQQAQEIHSFATRLDAAYRELETTQARLRETSFKDDVTGLYNRRFFSLRLEEELSRNRRFNHPVSVVLLDLDGFKAVNDDFGHAAGDETLRDVAQILMRHSRGINVVSRYGGDEFAILLVETPKAGALLYAERIRETVATFPFAHGNSVTASFGVASLPGDEAETGEELFRAADEALYRAKRAGKNQVATVPRSAAQVS